MVLMKQRLLTRAAPIGATNVSEWWHQSQNITRSQTLCDDLEFVLNSEWPSTAVSHNGQEMPPE
jgi:hypothetical protein